MRIRILALASAAALALTMGLAGAPSQAIKAKSLTFNVDLTSSAYQLRVQAAASDRTNNVARGSVKLIENFPNQSFGAFRVEGP